MPLLTPELLRRLEQFQLLAARRAKSSAKGERRSRARLVVPGELACGGRRAGRHEGVYAVLRSQDV